MKVENIYFYNHYHNGDIHLSREFVKYFLKNIQYNNSFYICNSKKELLYDLSLEVLNFENFSFLNENEQYLVKNDDLFINTWVGQKNRKYLNVFLNNAVNNLSNINIFKDISNNINIKFNMSLRETVPEVCFKNLPNKKVIEDFFLFKKNSILVCNNIVLSSQSENINLFNIINYLAKNYANVNFIITNYDNNIETRNNIFFVENIVKTKNNLIDISYISKFCNIIFGRASGPYEVCKIKDNIFDENKKFICFCKEKIDSSWIEEIYCDCEFLWSNSMEKIEKMLESECKKINF